MYLRVYQARFGVDRFIRRVVASVWSQSESIQCPHKCRLSVADERSGGVCVCVL